LVGTWFAVIFFEAESDYVPASSEKWRIGVLQEPEDIGEKGRKRAILAGQWALARTIQSLSCSCTHTALHLSDFEIVRPADSAMCIPPLGHNAKCELPCVSS
jgi:hypothetical protein